MNRKDEILQELVLLKESNERYVNPAEYFIEFDPKRNDYFMGLKVYDKNNKQVFNIIKEAVEKIENYYAKKQNDKEDEKRIKREKLEKELKTLL